MCSVFLFLLLCILVGVIHVDGIHELDCSLHGLPCDKVISSDISNNNTCDLIVNSTTLPEIQFKRSIPRKRKGQKSPLSDIGDQQEETKRRKLKTKTTNSTLSVMTFNVKFLWNVDYCVNNELCIHNNVVGEGETDIDRKNDKKAKIELIKQEKEKFRQSNLKNDVKAIWHGGILGENINKRIEEIANVIGKAKPDVVLLQEIRSDTGCKVLEQDNSCSNHPIMDSIISRLKKTKILNDYFKNYKAYALPPVQWQIVNEKNERLPDYQMKTIIGGKKIVTEVRLKNGELMYRAGKGQSLSVGMLTGRRVDRLEGPIPSMRRSFTNTDLKKILGNLNSKLKKLNEVPTQTDSDYNISDNEEDDFNYTVNGSRQRRIKYLTMKTEAVRKMILLNPKLRKQKIWTKPVGARTVERYLYANLDTGHTIVNVHMPSLLNDKKIAEEMAGHLIRKLGHIDKLILAGDFNAIDPIIPFKIETTPCKDIFIADSKNEIISCQRKKKLLAKDIESKYRANVGTGHFETIKMPNTLNILKANGLKSVFDEGKEINHSFWTFLYAKTDPDIRLSRGFISYEERIQGTRRTHLGTRVPVVAALDHILFKGLKLISVRTGGLLCDKYGGPISKRVKNFHGRVGFCEEFKDGVIGDYPEDERAIRKDQGLFDVFPSDHLPILAVFQDE